MSASAISPSPSYGFNASRRGAGRGRSRSSPGHPYRYSSKSRTTKKDVEKPHKSVNVWLLDVFIEEDDGKCPFEKCDDILFDEDMVIMKGYVMMNRLERDEFPIKMILCDLFQQRFTNIGPDDFGYLKRERNKLSLPKTGDGFVWNFENLKVLAGQGKLYCYIKESYKKLVDQPSPVDVNDEKITRSCDDSPSFPASSIVNKKHKSSTVVSDDELPSGSGELESYKSLLNEVLEASPKKKLYNDLESILHDLKKKISTSEVEKLKVDPDDCLSDALSFYKSLDFNPNHKLQVRYAKQPAADTGGVLRQFYSDCTQQLLEGADGIPPLFEEEENRKLPCFNAGVVMSGMIKFVEECLLIQYVKLELDSVVWLHLYTGIFVQVM